MLKKALHLLICLLFTGLLQAGTTGKISGRVTDAESGEGLPGTNVAIDGTAMGAAADLNGEFTILNVPPGLYNVKFAFIGYQAVVVKEVRVNVDFTTRLDQAMSASAVELAAIEVYGERNPLVRQDLTNTLVAITSEKISALPVDQIRDVIALTAGVITDNSGALHIRGGRANEVAYQVNGLSINNPFTSLQSVGLATNAVDEVSVSTGTFSAEYGDALSGVVNFVTKDGGQDYHGSARYWTGDHFSSRDDIFFNIDEIEVTNNQRVEWTLGGPVPLTGGKVTFFTSGVNQDDKGHLYGIDLYTPADWPFLFGDSLVIDPFGNPATVAEALAGQGGTPGASGSGSTVPMVTRDSWNLTGKVTWKPNNRMKLSYDIIYDKDDRFRRVVGGSNMFRRFRFNPAGRPKSTGNNSSHSFGLTHTLSNNTFYTLKLGLNQTKSRRSVFENPLDPRYFPNIENEIDNHIIEPTGSAGLGYLAGGTDMRWEESKSRTLLAKLDIVSQVLRQHEVKVGAEVKIHDLDFESFDLLFDFNNGSFVIPRPELNPNFTSYQSYDNQPVQAAFYIQDKMELAKQFILNAGLRYEYLDTKALYNPDLSGTVNEGVDSPQFLQQSETKHRLSPRLSLSFPITDEGIIRFSYGFFYQVPTFNKIYTNSRFEDSNFITTPTFGNANLEPERAIQYEMGLQQQFTDDFKVDLTIFYKDVNNLIQNRRVIAGDVALSKEFNVVTNISYANVRGFTASLLKRSSRQSLLSYSLDYTFQVGQGAFTDPLKLAADTRTGRNAEQEFVPLDFDRIHVINGTLTLAKPGKWAGSLINRFQTGTPFTPSVPSSVQDIQFDVNSAERPENWTIDMKLEKFFKVNNLGFSIFMQVDNLFDMRNERFVHLNTGKSLNNLNETIRENLFNDLRQTIANDPGNFFPAQFLDTFYQREDFLSEPREIRWGMSFDF